MSELDTIRTDFIAESRENLDQLERDLVALESDPSSAATLRSIFRTVHTIKGSAGFMGLPVLERLAHDGEAVLSRLRDGSLTITPVLATALLSLADAMRRMLTSVEQTGGEGQTDCAAIVEALDRACVSAPVVDVRVDVESMPQARDAGGASHVRINVDQLDRLMNLVGELVIARNQITRLASSETHAALLGTSQQLSAITTSLQEGIMKTRMLPIDTVWSKLPRVVRDCARVCGKQVRFDTVGKETELDRTLIEAIQDPLTHAVRNAVDHGIEAPAQRLALGKAAEGVVVLHASHEGGQITIDVSDDGAGIDVAAVTRKAIERRLIDADAARRLTDQDAMALIFLPGFSTKATATTVSGRGVGMDVVKTNIERIGGKVTVESRPGEGTTIRMRIPLTLAIMSALVVSAGDDIYAIPQTSVIELVRLTEGAARSRIETVGDAPVYRLRNTLLPLVWLASELAPEGAKPRRAESAATIVVLQAGGLRFGLVVDDAIDTQEIVVKPLGRHLREIPVFAGATLLGDGRIILILDVAGLAVRARVVADAQASGALSRERAGDAPAEHEPLLIVAAADGSRMAVPLVRIVRLEELPGQSVQWFAGRPVVQYRDTLLPLTRMEALLKRGTTSGISTTDGPLQTLVYSDGARQVGIVVDRIVGSAECAPDELRGAEVEGIGAPLVVDGLIAELVDTGSTPLDLTQVPVPATVTLLGAA